MTTRKILLSLSALALTIHIIWEIFRQTSWFWPWYNETIWGNPLRVELFWLPYTWLFLGAIILTAAAFLIKDPHQQPVPEWHKFSTYALSAVALFITGYAIFNSVKVCGADYLYAPTWMRIAMDIIGCAWLWTLTARPNVPELPRSLRSIIGTGIGLIALLWLLQLSSGISYLTTGHILMFRSHAFGSWLRYLVPTILLCSYSIYLLNKWPSVQLNRLHQMRNSHCAPGSFFERSYPAMRIASLVCLGLFLIAIFIMQSPIIYKFSDYSDIAVFFFMAIVVFSWLLLTFIAFFQLPNPRGYRIFNWVCLALSFIVFPIGFAVTILAENNTPSETAGFIATFIGFVALCTHIFVTAIRVILYTLPNQKSKDDTHMGQPDPFNLNRFVGAQDSFYKEALREIRNGRKEGHWIWFIFPQMKGLGYSPMAQNYGITSLNEARAYLAHPVLKSRLIEITEALLRHKDKTAYEIFGTIDAIKVRSCMTLFDLIEPNSIFADTLAAFYNNERDELTLNIINFRPL